MNEANAAILAISEQLLSSADMSYRKQMYKRSNSIYDLALQSLRPLQGSSNQEMMTLQVLIMTDLADIDSCFLIITKFFPSYTSLF